MRYAIVALGLIVTLGACGAELISGTLGPSRPGGIEGGTGGGPPSSPAVLTGSWLRTVGFYGSDGSLHVSETRWDFESSGAAVRVVTSTNVTYGISGVVITTARWRVESGDLVIDFLTPVTGTARFAWHVRELTGGTELVLGDLVFRRVPR